MKDYSELLATLLRTLSDLPGTDDDLFAEIDDQRRRAATAIRELIAENDQMVGIAEAWKARAEASESKIEKLKSHGKELVELNDRLVGSTKSALDRAEAAERERDEAKEELDTWRSVFPDIAPESVQPDRSLLEKRLEKYENALIYISDKDWFWKCGGSGQRSRDTCGKIAAKALGISEELPDGWPDPAKSETKSALAGEKKE